MEESIKATSHTILHAEERLSFHRAITYIVVFSHGIFWQCFILGTVLCNYFFTTFIYVYRIWDLKLTYLYLHIIDFIYLLDLLVKISYYRNSVLQNRLFIKRKSFTLLIIDCISLNQLDLMYSLFATLIYRDYILFILRSFTFLRLYHIQSVLGMWDVTLGTIQWTVILKFVLYWLIIIHSAASIWYYGACENMECPIEYTGTGYLVSISFSLLTVANAGYLTNIVANTKEALLSILSMMIGFWLLNCHYIGVLTTQVANNEKRASLFKEQLKQINTNLDSLKISKEEKRDINNYYSEFWRIKKGVKKTSNLSLLPLSLKRELYFDINFDFFHRSLLFRDLDESFLRNLSLYVKNEFYLPKNVIYYQNVVKTFMIYIKSGVVEVLSDEDGESPLIQFRTGTCIGEVALLMTVPSKGSIRAASHVELQVLHKVDIYRMLSNLPDITRKMKETLAHRLETAYSAPSHAKNVDRAFNIIVSQSKEQSPLQIFKKKLRERESGTLHEIKSSEQIDIQFETEFLELYQITDKTIPSTNNLCLKPNFPWVILPQSQIHNFWNYFIFVFVIMVCFLYPYYVATDGISSTNFYMLNFATETIFLLDIIVQCITAIQVNSGYVVNSKQILIHKLQSFGFILDILSVIPAEVMPLMIEDDELRYRIGSFLSFNRLLKAWTILKFFPMFETKFWDSICIFRTFKYTLYFILISYWTGIILYMEACNTFTCDIDTWITGVMVNHNHSLCYQNPILLSMYFALNLLSGVGYGDIYAGNEMEIVICFVSVACGTLLFGYCISEMSATFILRDFTKISYQEIVFAIMKFVKDNGIILSVENRLVNYFQLYWQYNRGITIITQKPLLYNSTTSIKRQILIKERLQTIRQTPMFKYLNLDLLHTIAEDSKMLILPPEEYIVNRGSVGRELYMIQQGFCIIFQNELEKGKIIGPNEHFGDLEMLFGVQWIVNVKTLTHCKLIVITHTDFSHASSNFPQSIDEINEVISDAKFYEKLQKFIDASVVPTKEKYATTSKKKHIRNLAQLFLVDNFFSSFVNVIKECHRSRTAYSSGFVQFGKLRFLQCCLIPVTVIPDSLFLILWSCIRLISSIMIGILAPIKHSVEPYNIFPVYITSMLDVLSYIDLYVMLHVCYYNEKGILVTHPARTATHYLSKNFVVDLFACFPFTSAFSILGIYTPNSSSMVINKMFQIYRLPAVFKYFGDNITNKTGSFITVKYLVIALMVTNMMASILFSFTCTYQQVGIDRGYMECRNISWIKASQFNELTKPEDMYLTALYWVLATCFGTGLGDITPQTPPEIFSCIILMLSGLMLINYVFASIGSSKVNLNSAQHLYQEMIKEANHFLEQERVNPSLRKQLVDYYNYLWRRTSGVNLQQACQGIHSGLQEDTAYCMYEATFKQVPLFESLPTAFIKVIAKHIKQDYFLKNSDIIRLNSIISTIYIIHRGRVEIMSKNNEFVIMGAGGMFGNLSSYLPKCCDIAISALQNVDCLVIESSIFYNILKEYPKLKNNLSHALKNVQYYLLPTEIVFQRLSMSEKRSILLPETTINIALSKKKKFSARVKAKQNEWLPYFILPDSTVQNVMSYVILCITYLTTITITYQVTFQDHHNYIWVINVITEIIFVLHMILVIHTSYCNQFGEYVMNLSKIRNRYLQNKLKVYADILPNLPYDLLAFPLPANQRAKMLTFLRLPHLGRCKYFFKFYKERSNLLMANKLILNVGMMYIGISLLAHVCACIWYFIECPFSECESNSTVHTFLSVSLSKQGAYIISFYYIIALFTTTGFGDVIPYSIIQVAFTSLLLFISKFYVASLIGNMTSVMDSLSSTLLKYRYRTSELYDFIKNQDAKKFQLQKIWDYVKLLWDHGHGKQMPEFILDAPFCLRSDLMDAMFGYHIRKCKIFARVNEDFIRILVMKLQCFLFFEGNYIVQHGDIDEQMYFLHRGEVVVLTVHQDLTETHHQTLRAPDIFGVRQGLFHGLPHHFSYRAQTKASILTLNLNDWYTMLDYFPNEKKLIYTHAAELFVNLME